MSTKAKTHALVVTPRAKRSHDSQMREDSVIPSQLTGFLSKAEAWAEAQANKGDSSPPIAQRAVGRASPLPVAEVGDWRFVEQAHLEARLQDAVVLVERAGQVGVLE
jgi:hypothetical protein